MPTTAKAPLIAMMAVLLPGLWAWAHAQNHSAWGQIRQNAKTMQLKVSLAVWDPEENRQVRCRGGNPRRRRLSRRRPPPHQIVPVPAGASQNRRQVLAQQVTLLD